MNNTQPEQTMNENPSPVPDKARVRRSFHTKVKPRSDCKFWLLKPEQQKLVLEWLFEKNLPCRDITARCDKQFGLYWSSSSVSGFFRRVKGDEMQDRMFETAKDAEKIVGKLGRSPKIVTQAVKHIAAHVMYEAAIPSEPGRKPNTRLLMQGLPLLMDAEKDEREEQKLKLEREQWEFDVARTCHDHIKELAKIIANEALDEPGRLQEIRRQLFGKNLAPEER
jgi:hypothetical protein